MTFDTGNWKDGLTTLAGGATGTEALNIAIESLMVNGFSAQGIILIVIALFSMFTGYQAYRKSKVVVVTPTGEQSSTVAVASVTTKP